MHDPNQRDYVETTLYVPSGESRDRVEGNRVSHPGEELVPYKVPIVVMNRRSRTTGETKRLARRQKKARQDEGWQGSKGGRRGSRRGRVLRLRWRFLTGRSGARRRLGGRGPGGGGTAGWSREEVEGRRCVMMRVVTHPRAARRSASAFP